MKMIALKKKKNLVHNISLFDPIACHHESAEATGQYKHRVLKNESWTKEISA